MNTVDNKRKKYKLAYSDDHMIYHDDLLLIQILNLRIVFRTLF